MKNISSIVSDYILDTLIETTIPSTQGEMIAVTLTEADIETAQSILNIVTTLKSNELQYGKSIETWLKTTQQIGKEIGAVLENEAENIARALLTEMIRRG